MSGEAGPWSKLAAVITAEREMAGRGLVVLVDVGSHRVEDRRVTLAVGAARVVRADATDAELRTLNQQRDVLLPSGTSVVFLLPDRDAARRVLRLTPDLTAIVDLTLELRVTTHLDAASLRERLRARQAALHRRIDLTGLVPHTGEGVSLPIDEVYLRAAGLPEEVQLDKPVLAVGPPGAGKTTTLRWLSWTHAVGHTEGHLIPADRLAVYVPLASWAAMSRDGTTTVVAFLERYLGGLIGEESVGIADHLGSMALLFDGLDEVPGVRERRGVLEQVLELVHQGARVVVSGRDHVLDDLRAADHDRWNVQRWRTAGPEEVEPLVRAILHARGVAKEAADELYLSLIRHPDFHLFTATPLLLTFLVVLSSMHRQVPSQRAELYSDLIEMLISNWRRIRSDTGRTLRRGDVLRVVAPLGWQLVARGVGGLTEAELLLVLFELEQRTTPNAESARAQARQRLDQLRSDTALLQTSDGLWRFNHPTIAEYLAAEAVLQDPEKLKALVAAPYAPEWSQVVAFTLAITVDLRPRDDVSVALLDALEKGARRRGVYDAKIPRTLALCLREVAGIPEHRRVLLAEHVLRIAFKRKLSGWARLDAILAVANVIRAADPLVIAVLERWFASPMPWIGSLEEKLPPAWSPLYFRFVSRALRERGIDAPDVHAAADRKPTNPVEGADVREGDPALLADT